MECVVPLPPAGKERADVEPVSKPCAEPVAKPIPEKISLYVIHSRKLVVDPLTCCKERPLPMTRACRFIETIWRAIMGRTQIFLG